MTAPPVQIVLAALRDQPTYGSVCVVGGTSVPIIPAEIYLASIGVWLREDGRSYSCDIRWDFGYYYTDAFERIFLRWAIRRWRCQFHLAAIAFATATGFDEDHSLGGRSWGLGRHGSIPTTEGAEGRNWID